MKLVTKTVALSFMEVRFFALLMTFTLHQNSQEVKSMERLNLVTQKWKDVYSFAASLLSFHWSLCRQYLFSGLGLVTFAKKSFMLVLWLQAGFIEGMLCAAGLGVEHRQVATTNEAFWSCRQRQEGKLQPLPCWQHHLPLSCGRESRGVLFCIWCKVCGNCGVGERSPGFPQGMIIISLSAGWRCYRGPDRRAHCLLFWNYNYLQQFLLIYFIDLYPAFSSQKGIRSMLQHLKKE